MKIFLYVGFLILFLTNTSISLTDTVIQNMKTNNGPTSLKTIVNYIYQNESISHENIERNFNQIKACVLNRNIPCVANYMMIFEDGTLINYDFTHQNVTSITYLKKNYDKIFTVKVLNAIKNQKISELSYSADGIMIGRGQMWLDYFCGLDKSKKCYLKIRVINT